MNKISSTFIASAIALSFLPSIAHSQESSNVEAINTHLQLELNNSCRETDFSNLDEAVKCIGYTGYVMNAFANVTLQQYSDLAWDNTGFGELYYMRKKIHEACSVDDINNAATVEEYYNAILKFIPSCSQSLRKAATSDNLSVGYSSVLLGSTLAILEEHAQWLGNPSIESEILRFNQ